MKIMKNMTAATCEGGRWRVYENTIIEKAHKASVYGLMCFCLFVLLSYELLKRLQMR